MELPSDVELIGLVAIDVLRDTHDGEIKPYAFNRGWLEEMHEIHIRLGRKRTHPLNDLSSVLSTMDRHCKSAGALWTKHYYNYNTPMPWRGYKMIPQENL